MDREEDFRLECLVLQYISTVGSLAESFSIKLSGKKKEEGCQAVLHRKLKDVVVAFFRIVDCRIEITGWDDPLFLKQLELYLAEPTIQTSPDRTFLCAYLVERSCGFRCYDAYDYLVRTQEHIMSVSCLIGVDIVPFIKEQIQKLKDKYQGRK